MGLIGILGLFPLLACRFEPAPSETGDSAAPGPAIEGVSVELADVGTVVRVSWSTSEETAGHVAFGETPDLGHMSDESGPSSQHEVLLFGMPADTEVYLQIVTNSQTSALQTITTGPLPTGMPSLAIEGEASGWAYQILPIQGAVYAIGVIDSLGRYVWYDQPDPTGNLMRALLSRDGEWIRYLQMDYKKPESTRIVSVSIDGGEKTEQTVPGAHHDMVELPDGTIATIVSSHAPKGWSTESVADTIVEISPDGTWTEIWNSWIDLDLKSANVDYHDNWTLGNALDYVEEEDAYYLSMKSLGGMARVDRGSGATDWVLGSEIDDFEYEDGTDPVELQHGVDRVAGGLLIFDNGAPDRGYARVVELALDEDEMTATEVWSYVRDPKVDVYAMGDVARMPDGNTQIVWSTSGEIRTVTPEGETVWKLNTDLGEGIAYVQILEAWGAW